MKNYYHVGICLKDGKRGHFAGDKNKIAELFLAWTGDTLEKLERGFCFALANMGGIGAVCDDFGGMIGDGVLVVVTKIARGEVSKFDTGWELNVIG